ncbi:AAA family ATPase [Herbiconiux sp. CPCC 205763]|uniref:AAA family ATPase n=1 Tax=Herbiconiux aconitum TaxID=2970913 RepID=A0ABT2GRN8_9MICO|nr:ATP-binding protein [Herbiconiux aconitum]MCS5718833.1 AAA family ATPase [Herbiconiux aconitum]
MLIRFAVENFRSINEAVEVSMVAMDREFEAARPAGSIDQSLLTVVGIFGPNASGKSNILAAIDWLRRAVTLSLRSWDEGIPVEPFAFGGKGKRPTTFWAEYLVDGVRFEYQLEVDEARVIYEGLFHFPTGRRRRIFEREGLELKLQDGLGELSGIRKVLTERSLVLSIARRFAEPLTLKFAQQVRNTNSRGLDHHPSQRWRRDFGAGMGIYNSTRWFEIPELDSEDISQDERDDMERSARNDREQGLALLQMADLGIVDVVRTEDEDVLERSPRRRTLLVHEADGERYPLEMHLESAGTQTWFRLVGPLLDTLRRGGVLVFDEIDASLHPKLSAEVLGLFANPQTNPHNAQLIFTSHDASLLARLNRDQIWLTEKDDKGSTSITPLTDFGGDRVRKSQNLEKAYLEGRFGGIPDVDMVGVFRALGLIG